MSIIIDSQGHREDVSPISQVMLLWFCHLWDSWETYFSLSFSDSKNSFTDLPSYKEQAQLNSGVILIVTLILARRLPRNIFPKVVGHSR